MATSCNKIRTNLALQTPVFDSTFLNDFISDMPGAAFVGRHQTDTWNFEADRFYFDKMHVMQPDFVTPWQVIDASECGTACEPPSSFIGFGTTRDSAVMEQLNLRSQPYCLQQLSRVPHVGKQISAIYKIVRTIPLAFTNDFLRTRFTSYNDTLQIAGSAFNTFAITAANTGTQLTTINLGSTALLPTSNLNWAILNYYSQLLGMKGYDTDSGLPTGMRNLVTHSRTFQSLVGTNPELRSMIQCCDMKNLSPLYMPGKGINAEPFGQFAPSFDEQQLRFQTNGSGLLQRVLPYTNTAATTGEKPIVNPAWFNARYAISYIIHPKAATLWTIKPKKIHEMVPSVNSSIWGTWDFINDNVLIWVNPDGTTCTKNNENRFYFYWLAHLELGFQYEQRDLVMPILHLIDGAGANCVVDTTVCGSAPQYVTQSYDSDPAVCET